MRNCLKSLNRQADYKQVRLGGVLLSERTKRANFTTLYALIGGAIKSVTAALVVSSIALTSSVNAQQSSDIWIGKLNIESKTPITDLIRVTNTASYTNQPYFFDNTRLYYTQMHAIGDQAQTDIHLFDLAIGQDSNLSQSPTSEYSPTPIPNKQAFSVIRVNAEGKQELWELDLRGNPKQHLVPEVEPVGYQVWLDSTQLLLFVLGEPNTLQKVDITKPEDNGIVFDQHIGASLSRYKQSPWFLYSKNYDVIVKSDEPSSGMLAEIEQGNWLYAFNRETSKIRRVASLPDTSEYFALTPSGFVLTSDGTQVMSRQLIEEDDEKLMPFEKWRPIKITQKECQMGVSRIAVSNDGSMIALVCPNSE